MAERLLELWLLLFRRISVARAPQIPPEQGPRPASRPKRKAKRAPRKRTSVPGSAVFATPSLESTSGPTPVYTSESIVEPEAKAKPKPKSVYSYSESVSPAPEPAGAKPVRLKVKSKDRPPTPFPSTPSVFSPPKLPVPAPVPAPVPVMADPGTPGMCKPADEEALHGWRASIFTYITGKDGKRRRVFKLFHKPPKPKDDEEGTGRHLFSRQMRSCPRRRRCGSCEETAEPWGCGSWLEYTLMVSLSVILLLGSLGLCVFWVTYYRGGFAWNENPTIQFNLHPVFMITGFVVFGGFAMMLYRICRCCQRLYVKLLHALLHALTAPCAVIGLMAVMDYHKKSVPQIPDFYSLHSWMGGVTIALFCLQFFVGLFSFLVLLMCKDATASFRIRLIPIHATFGLATFILAVATCLSGLNQRAILTLGEKYSEWQEEGIVINALGATLIAIAILVIVSVRRYNRQRCPRVTSDPNAS